MGRYGDSTLADVTADASGELAPIHNLSGLLTVEATPTPRLAIYLNYGGDYAGRADYASATAHHAGRSQRYLLPTGHHCRHRFDGLLDQAHGSDDRRRRHVGRPLVRSHRATAVGYGSRFRCLKQLELQHHHQPRLQRRKLHRLPSRRLLRRTNPRRAGDHRRLLVRHLQRRPRPLPPRLPVRLRSSRGLGRWNPRRRRQGHRQHVLDQPPLLSPITAEIRYRQQQKRQPANRAASSAFREAYIVARMISGAKR